MLDAANKGMPFTHTDGLGWNLFGGDPTFPVAVIRESALARNRASMSDYCRRNGVSLAPHGKTTMSPELFQLQLQDGSWAITAANVYQARVMRDNGVPRVLIANEVTAPGDIAWLAEQVEAGFEVICYVDSLAGVRLLRERLSGRAATTRLGVLIELGVPGGRTGARSVDQALQVAREAAASESLRVVGVAGFEGIIGPSDGATAEARVDEFLVQMARLAEAIVEERLPHDVDEFILTAGGSMFFDRVVETFGRARVAMPTRVVVRSGCYLSHDDGVIDDLSPLGARPRIEGDTFHAAIEVWAPVLSRPEPTRLILGAGKRDLGIDSRLPIAKKWVQRGTRETRAIDARPRAVRVDDQHSYLDIDPTSEIAVGDYVGLGISHPCTTFDKWKVMLVVDDDYDVVDMITTHF